MSNRTPLLDACPPRPIAQAGDQYAADIIRGLSEELATSETAADFLDTTHLTKDTADFLRMAMDRIALGRDSTSPSVYQLYSRYGGGKTHSLLLLAAAAKYPHLPYWQDDAQCDPASAKVIAFDGEKHNVVNGTQMDDQDNRAKSLAGYVLYHLGGPTALRDFGEGDATLADPGSDAFRRLIGDEPVIIVIDELVHYINRVNQRAASDSRVSAEGVLTTLSALINAVANSPRAVLVITTPEDSHELLEESNAATTGDAHHADALALTAMLDRVNSQVGRVMHPVAPSGEADLPAILRKRLFYGVDEAARQDTANAYTAVSIRNGRANGSLVVRNLCNDGLIGTGPFPGHTGLYGDYRRAIWHSTHPSFQECWSTRLPGLSRRLPVPSVAAEHHHRPPGRQSQLPARARHPAAAGQHPAGNAER